MPEQPNFRKHTPTHTCGYCKHIIRDPYSWGCGRDPKGTNDALHKAGTEYLHVCNWFELRGYR